MSRFMRALKFWKKSEKIAEDKKKRADSIRDSYREPEKAQPRSQSDEELFKTTDEEAGDIAVKPDPKAAEAAHDEEEVDERDGEEEREAKEEEEASPPAPEQGIEFAPEDGLQPDHPYNFMSPWYPIEFIMEGNFWQSIEHYMQSKRGTSAEWREQVRKAETVEEAIALGNAASEGDECNESYEEERDQLLKDVLQALFVQNKDLAERLIATSQLLLYTSSDAYWGTVDEERSGANAYGRVLSEIRQDMRMKKLKQAVASGTPLSM